MASQYTLHELARFLQAKLIGDANAIVTGVADLEHAGPEEASFLANSRYVKFLSTTRASVVLVSPDADRIEEKNYLVVPDPSSAFQQLIELFNPPSQFVSAFTGIHPTSVIHETAVIGANVTIGPHTVIDRDVQIDEHTIIGPGCSIGPKVKIGSHCTLYAHVVIREGCIVGARVILQPGAVIGSCGFGYTQNKKGHHSKLDQLGIVIIEDDVEVGANTTIDRARFQATRIGQGTKIDNQVQIAHGVEIGKHSLIISQVGIAGSTTIGNYVVLAGKVAVNGHITIGDHVRVAACSGVSKPILEPGEYAGIPVMPREKYNRTSVRLRNIEKFIDEHKELQEKVEQFIDNQEKR